MAKEIRALHALFCGLGSIGTRHLGNLAALCGEKGIRLSVDALRSSARALPPQTARLLHREFTALPETGQWDVAFVTAPTQQHAPLLKLLRGRAGAYFIEKPLFEHSAYSLPALGLAGGVKAYVAAPLRHTALYAALREKLAGYAPYSARVICSSYLPGWRPNADYRQVYSAQTALGGGVTLDLIHEWDYLYDLFGAPASCRHYRGKFSQLEIDSDDLAVYIARYPQLLCEIHLDYFGRKYRREIELFCENGSIIANFGSGTLQLPNGACENHAEDGNRPYEREMTAFMRYLAGEVAESTNSPQHALEVLKIALGEA